MSTEFSPVTATPEEMSAHVEKSMRARQLSYAEKVARRHDIIFALRDGGQFQYQLRKALYGFADETKRLEDPAFIAAHRLLWEAEKAWIEANPDSDVTSTRIDYVKQSLRKDLGHLTELSNALSWVTHVDDYSDHYAPGEAPQKRTETHAKLEKLWAQSVRELQTKIACTWTRDEVDFLTECQNRAYSLRTKKKWFFSFLSGGLGKTRLTDIPFQAMLPHSFHVTFDNAIAYAPNLAAVKRICALWYTPVQVERIEGAGVVFPEERNEDGLPYFYVRPLEVSDDACRAARVMSKTQEDQ